MIKCFLIALSCSRFSRIVNLKTKDGLKAGFLHLTPFKSSGKELSSFGLQAISKKSYLLYSGPSKSSEGKWEVYLANLNSKGVIQKLVKTASAFNLTFDSDFPLTW